MSVIKGKNVWLYWTDEDDVLKPMACMRSCTLTTLADLFETSTLGTGKWRTFRGNRVSWEVACEGLQSFDTNMTVSALRRIQLNMVPIFIAFTATDDNGITETYNGYVLVTSIESGSTYNDLYKYSIAAQGNGELILTDIPVDPNILGGCVMIYPYNATGTETNGGHTLPAIPDLEDKNVKWLFRDGVEYRRVTSAPSGKQFMLDAADPTVIIFSSDSPPTYAGLMIDVVYCNN